MTGVRPIVGRDAELAELARGLREAAAGHGGLWFLAGEPGIGKSRLAEEVAARAIAEGVTVLWGRCWEAGGAPAYWPWIEVLRALYRAGRDGPDTEFWRPRAPVLSQLLPELGPLAPDRPPALDAERARFQLLDAIVATLCDAASARTLLVIAEDLHVADESTISVLSLLQAPAQSTRLSVIGTLRDAGSLAAAGKSALLRLVHGTRCLPLTRLDRRQVAEFLSLSTGAPASAAASEAVHRTTEGNPLFVTEVARLLAVEPGAAQSGFASVPRSIRHAIRARLEHLSSPTRAVLDVASVMGREFRAAALSQLAGRALADLEPSLAEALDAGVLFETAAGEYRFSHVLLREVLHQELPEQRRSELHRQAAEALRRAAPTEPPWSEIAHHLLEAGQAGRELAVEACREAATAALRQFAFADAAQWYTRALTALGAAGAAPGRRAALLLELAEAQIQSGAIELGQSHCMQAVALARQLASGELLARAALVHGAVLQFAVVDPMLVALLREALAALPESARASRAVIMARLAAAEQPAPEPETAFALARDAISIARAHGEPGTLLDTLRFAISALMDLAEPRERLDLNREYVRLANLLGQPLEALRGTMRQTFDHLELGDVVAVDACIETLSEISGRLGHPFYTWRASSFRAMQATFLGQFALAHAELERAEQLGRQGRDPNALRAVALQRHALARLRDVDDELRRLLPELARVMPSSELGGLLIRILTAEGLLRGGRRDQAAAHLEAGDLERMVDYGDMSLFSPLANIALALKLEDLAERACRRIERRGAVFTSGGMTGMSFGEPLQQIAGTLHRICGRLDEAEHCYERAVAQALQAGGRPIAAWAAYDLAELLVERGDAPRVARARELLERLVRDCAELDLPGLARRATLLMTAACAEPSAVVATVPTPSVAPAPLSLEREGESWVLAWGEAQLRLQDSKGLRWLARLIREPEREFHVLDLIEAEGTIDRGDAGELLDASARDAYRQRARDLKSELDSAEAACDAGRIERLRRELEFLERELGRALGLGGRERRAGAAAERARINVQRRLRDAVRRVATQHPELGKHLERSLKTGLFCSYRP